MIVDSSAIMAIIQAEPEADRFTDLILRAPVKRLSAASLVELTAVGIRRELFTVEALNVLIEQFGLIVEPVTVQQAGAAQAAYARYGIGTGDAAGLNFGDCFSYALALAMAEPLLFKGNDFSRTDVAAAA